MTAAELIAQADAADRKADAIFERVGRGAPCRVEHLEGHYLFPAGSRPEIEKASDLRRHARNLRAEANDIDAVPPVPTSTPARPVAALSPSQQAGVETPKPPEVLTPDPVAAIVARILASDGLPQDRDTERAPTRIKKGGGPADVEDVARRILEA